MIALTNRLNERDETIIYLQEELDAYDKIHRETEINMEFKSDRVKQLEDYIQMNGLQIPQEDGEPENLHHIKNENIQLKRYAPYCDEMQENQVPMGLMSADEKIEELHNVIEQLKHEPRQDN